MKIIFYLGKIKDEKVVFKGQRIAFQTRYLITADERNVLKKFEMKSKKQLLLFKYKVFSHFL